MRDQSERDLGQHLETALRGAIIGERWIKCAFAITVTVLEGEEDCWWLEQVTDGNEGTTGGAWGIMAVLAGCITVASAAIIDAGIDCVGLLVGGFAGSVGTSKTSAKGKGTTSEGNEGQQLLLDPCPSEHNNLQSACVVGYLEERDEVTEIWMQGNIETDVQNLVDRAVEAAVITRKVLAEAVTESASAKFPELRDTGASEDVDMAG